MIGNATSSELLSAEVIGSIPIFQGLSVDEARALACIATTVEHNPGDLVLEQGKRSRQLWILLEGRCEVIKADEPDPTHPHPAPFLLATLEPLQNFGEMSFFHSAAHSASVRAKSRVKLLRIERECFDEAARKSPLAAYKLMTNILASMAERLRRMDDWVADLMTQSAPNERVPEWNRLREQLFNGWKL